MSKPVVQEESSTLRAFAVLELVARGDGPQSLDELTQLCGLPKPSVDHAQRTVRAALRMVAYLAERNRTAAFKWALRVGAHSGPVVAGVVGKRKYAFDIWGDTVNISARMEAAADAGRVATLGRRAGGDTHIQPAAAGEGGP